MSMLAYGFQEALASLVRGGRGAIMSMGTIAIAFLALGGFLLITSNLQRVAQLWMDSAEVSVFLRDDISGDARTAIESQLQQDSAALRVDYVTKEEAVERFRGDFPELADVATTLGTNPFPASFEVRLRPGSRVADDAARMSTSIVALDGVADVQFDRRWLERVLSLIAGVRAAGLAVTVVLLLGAAFTVTAVVRLSLHARRDELDIMQLVGAPISFIRGSLRHRGVAARGHWRSPGHPRAGCGLRRRPGMAGSRLGGAAGRADGELPVLARYGTAYRGRAGGGIDGWARGFTCRPLTRVNRPLYTWRRRTCRGYGTASRVPHRPPRVDAGIAALIEFYREEFLKHHQCLQEQREVLLGAGHLWRRTRPPARDGRSRKSLWQSRRRRSDGPHCSASSTS